MANLHTKIENEDIEFFILILITFDRDEGCTLLSSDLLIIFSSHRLEFLGDSVELKTAISSILAEDPRSAYRRQKCASLLYYFTVDAAHITSWFEEDMAEVLRVRPFHTAIPRMIADT